MSSIDNGLDDLIGLTGAISQKSHVMNAELKDQNRMMDNTIEHMDKTDANIQNATEKVKAVGETGKCNFIPFIVLAVLVVYMIILIVLISL